jgi:hypothetical protein
MDAPVGEAIGAARLPRVVCDCGRMEAPVADPGAGPGSGSGPGSGGLARDGAPRVGGRVRLRKAFTGDPAFAWHAFLPASFRGFPGGHAPAPFPV